MNTLSMSYVKDFISAHTGLNVEEKTLSSTVISRMKVLGFDYVDAYCRFLESDSPESKKEWKELCQIITTGESFFFRDKGQFHLIRYTILKAIIEANRDAKSLRIWSAGCSTGEEPYSLAITVMELLPEINLWNVSIIGTDINEDAIEKARKGQYSDWSFRMVDPGTIAAYFKRRKGMYELDERVRRMVVFRQGNLIRDAFPDAASGICDIDLILCRNVFIYFQPDNIALALGKLSRTLNKGGYLITGHAELQSVPLIGLAPVTYPQSIIYRRVADCPAKEQRPFYNPPMPLIIQPIKQISVINIGKNVTINKSAAMPVKPVEARKVAAGDKAKAATPEGGFYAEAQALYKEGKYLLAIEKAAMFLKDNPRHYDAHVLLLRSYANTGDLKRAADVCASAIGVDSLRPEPYYMLAQIAEEQGNTDDAVVMFNRVIYLNPRAVAAYLELNAIYEHEGDPKKGVKLVEAAVKILERLPADGAVEFYDGVTAGELLAHLRKTYRPGGVN
ncbi:MAG: tetratricopeptide repeat protein [Candidatus Magnetominusculus sp. LBB02]|nr:tetratricopeptide repeat protein [Candidatus Magnetominusculus sp. LBB02]